MDVQKPDAIKRYDNPRPLFPGQHRAHHVGGHASWLLTKRHPSLAVRTLGVYVGATLVARAAHGHDLMGGTMRWTPIGGGIKRPDPQ
jgi:hypothetical protein